MAIGARANQIITGTAITLGAIGLTGTIYRQAYGVGGAGLDLPTLAEVPVPGLANIPVIGEALFRQPAPTYLALLALPLAWWFLFRTRVGLALRATGEAAATAHATGVPTRALRTLATVIGGAFGGLAGATLVLAQVGTFAERMTAGRGFVAIAIVVLGRWHPAGVGSRRFSSARRRRFNTSSRQLGRGRALPALSDVALRADPAGARRSGRAGAATGGAGPRSLVDPGLALQPPDVGRDAGDIVLTQSDDRRHWPVAPMMGPHSERDGALKGDVRVVVRLVVDVHQRGADVGPGREPRHDSGRSWR